MRRPLSELTAGLVVAMAAASLGACDRGESVHTENGRPTTADGRWELAPRPPRSVSGYQGVSAHVVDDLTTFVAEVDYDQTTVKVLTHDPSTNRWSTGAGSAIWWRYGSARVATDDEILLHGGCCGPAGSGSRAAGFAYDPRRNRWREIAPGPLGNRFGHTGVWTGRRVIFWGGSDGEVHEDGAAYDPKADAWHGIAPAPIKPREDHASVWTGEEMIVWGGVGRSTHDRQRFLRDGAAYDPSADRWRRIPRAPISPQLGPEAEPDATDAVWTGREVVAWNGQEGAAYDPDANSWRRIPGAPSSQRSSQGTDSVVWTGEEMIVWGGVHGGDDFLASGAAYDPDADRWQVLPDSPLEGRDRHAAVWTPDGMLVWGGCCHGATYFRDGAFFNAE